MGSTLADSRFVMMPLLGISGSEPISCGASVGSAQDSTVSERTRGKASEKMMG